MEHDEHGSITVYIETRAVELMRYLTRYRINRD